MIKDLKDIRSSFIDFFAKHSHTPIKSSGLVPDNDNSLLFTNSGMVQFKEVFLGLTKPKYNSAVTVQKCLRAGGKHNDLDNVGYTARHHTFFEMLGNFSFGAYFKEQAIVYAWTYLTEVLGLSKSRLYVTHFHEDLETRLLWKKITGFDDSRIISINTADNFWQMGNEGPCGPCTEIFYDRGESVAGGLPGTAEADGDRYVEVWNLVFMQYEQLSDGSRIKLPDPCVDTGMGLERLSSVIQGKLDNYDIDLFAGLISYSKHLSKNKPNDSIFSHRVLADHARATAFLISDGVLPNNEGRGYVLRRIMRRALKNVHNLGSDKYHFSNLSLQVVELMQEAYPELSRSKSLIQTIIRQEEDRFTDLLDRGLTLFHKELQKLTVPVLSGEVAFKLYDTYGFPLDLTEDLLKQELFKGQPIQVDLKAYEQAMELQKERGRNASQFVFTETETQQLAQVVQGLKPSLFVGYETLVSECHVLGLVQEGVSVTKATEGSKVVVVLDKTPFYAESGGQVADTGVLTGLSCIAKVVDVKKYNDGKHFAHYVDLQQGSLEVGSKIQASVDSNRRSAIRSNHSATHLLQKELKQLLGNQVFQKGSYVGDNYFRFDFSHSQPLSQEELTIIERGVNAIIYKNLPTNIELDTFENAVEKGALFLPGEKYQDTVRIVSLGVSEEGVYSKELCGGTHVTTTGEIGAFVIVKQEAVGSGVRRIEAVTRQEALTYLNQFKHSVLQLQQHLKVNTDIVNYVLNEQQKTKQLEKKLLIAEQSLLKARLLQLMQSVGSFRLSIVNAGETMSDFKSLIEGIHLDSLEAGIIYQQQGAKLSLAVVAGNSLNPKDLIQQLMPKVNAKGSSAKGNYALTGSQFTVANPTRFEQELLTLVGV